MARQLKALMIGAHPDDCDFRCAGLTMRYVEAGHKVKYISMTDGSGGHQNMEPAALAARRFKETQAVAAYAGIEYDVWDITDGRLVATLEARERLIREIRTYKPDIIITHRTCDYHPDHRNTAMLVQDASYLLIVPNICPDVAPLEKMPVILFFYDGFLHPIFKPDIVVSLDGYMDRKMEMLSQHESQMFEWLPYTYGQFEDVPKDPAARLEWLHEPRVTEKTTDDEILNTPLNYVASELRDAVPAVKYRDKLIERYGEEKGRAVRFAESYEVSEYGAPLTEEEAKVLFPF